MSVSQCQRSDQQLLPPYTQRADHTAHSNATKPLRVVMATAPLQPIKTPPLLSPLATAAAPGLPWTRTPSNSALCGVLSVLWNELQDARCFFLLVFLIIKLDLLKTEVNVCTNVYWGVWVVEAGQDRSHKHARAYSGQGCTNTSGRREGMCHHTQPQDDSGPSAGPLLDWATIQDPWTHYRHKMGFPQPCRKGKVIYSTSEIKIHGWVKGVTSKHFNLE